MLAPHNPGKGATPEEKARHARDLQDQKENPSNWGYPGPRTVPGRVGVGTQAAQQPAPKKAGTAKKDDGAADAAEEKDRRITAAIATILAAGENLGDDGKPDVVRIEALAGIEVSSGERDAVWNRLQEAAKPADTRPPGEGADAPAEPADPPPKRRLFGRKKSSKKAAKKK